MPTIAFRTIAMTATRSDRKRALAVSSLTAEILLQPRTPRPASTCDMIHDDEPPGCRAGIRPRPRPPHGDRRQDQGLGRAQWALRGGGRRTQALAGNPAARLPARRRARDRLVLS